MGEPPSPGEITAFVFDPSSDKRTKLIDRLLADSRYGENWGRYWRDVIVARRSAAELQILTLVAQPLENFLTDSLNRKTEFQYDDAGRPIRERWFNADGTIASIALVTASSCAVPLAMIAPATNSIASVSVVLPAPP